MRMAKSWYLVVAPVTASLLAGVLAWGCQSQQRSSGIEIDGDDIGGVVTSESGPEAGVWVIAETNTFDTRFAKIVVTDDQGRYLIPDLPEAGYRVWVRGYGLVDSPSSDASLGNILDFTATVAPDPATAAQVYPATHWYSMMHLPDESEVAALPGGLNQYLQSMKNIGCVGCHQLGQESTRTLPAELGDFESSEVAWLRRLRSGQAGALMERQVNRGLLGVPLKYLADWTDRIAAGELPSTQPKRPTGRERDVVATIRDWARPLRVHARPDLHGPLRPNGERLRADLRCAGAQHRRLPYPRPDCQCGHELQGVRPRSGYADDREYTATRTVAVLGR